MFIQSQRVFLPLPMGEPAPAVQPCSLVYGERGKIWMCPRVYSWKVYMFGNLYSWKVYMLTCLEACRTSSEDKIIYINKPHHPKFRFFEQVFFWRILVENHCPPGLVKSQQHIGTCAQWSLKRTSDSNRHLRLLPYLTNHPTKSLPKINIPKPTCWNILTGLMVLTILKNISQWEGLSPIVYGKINSCSKPPTSWTFCSDRDPKKKKKNSRRSRGCGCHHWCGRGLQRQVRGYGIYGGGEMVDLVIQ